MAEIAVGREPLLQKDIYSGRMSITMTTTIQGNFVDILARQVYPAEVELRDGKVAAIRRLDCAPLEQYILPGFIDAHVHIESSMLAPSEFARMAVIHGTVATVSDPHEIANVLGMEGVRFMIENGKQVPFHFYFGAPSCVPATPFETAGAVLSAREIDSLLQIDKLNYLSEMMNYPGVLNADPEVLEKIRVAKSLGRPVDGHAPGLRGESAKRYIEAGISTDHECFTLEEALDKLRYGMKIIIREGSAAKNYDALHPIIRSHPFHVMFCSDDKHPHELAIGHINTLVKRSIIDHSHDLFHILRAACIAPIEHYKLAVGQLRVGDSADCIVVDNLRDFTVLQTYIKGQLVAERGRSLIPRVDVPCINQFNTLPKKESDFAVPAQGDHIRVIVALDGQITTSQEVVKAVIEDGNVVTDVSQDLLKLVVVNRYEVAPPAVAFVKNFGLRHGALASSIAHDSHNIIAVGCNDRDLCTAVNAIIDAHGGIAAVSGDTVHLLPLPLAGIMSPDDAWTIARTYETIDAVAKSMGSSLQAPFMTLSFMALLVIPSLKLSDRGLFDVNQFAFTSLFTESSTKVTR